MPAPAQSANKPLIKKNIPRSGEALPVIGIGTWQTFDVGPKAPQRAELGEVLRLFSDAGGAVIDSSPMYGESERVVGDLTAQIGNRDRLFFATKVWTQGRDAGIREIEKSLKLMRTERMDLMQVHNLLDLATHEKTLQEWKAAGKIRYLGITHYHAGARSAHPRPKMPPGSSKASRRAFEASSTAA